MKTVTVTELREVLARVNRPQPVSMIALTDAEALKEGNTLPGRLLKLAKYRGWVGKYEGMVNNQIAREGNADTLNFVAAPRKWGRHESLALVSHVTKDGEARWYLAAQILAPTDPMYLVEHVQRVLRRNRQRLVGIKKAEIAHLLPVKAAPRGQGTVKPIIHRDIDLRNLRTVAIGGEVYKVKQEA